MSYKFLSIEKRDAVLEVYLNRPEIHNAINSEMISELSSLFESLYSESDLRLLIIRGKGKSFSSGADLNYMKELAGMSKQENSSDALILAKLFHLIYNCDIPVISVAHGNVAGGANGIIAASDYAISTNDTIFRFPELRLGLIPATIAPYLIDRMGRARSSELLLSGRAFSGFDAERYSLVNSSVPSAQMEQEIERISRDFLRSAPNNLRETKRLIRKLSPGLGDKNMMEYTAELIAEARASEEGREGIQAFFDNRKPNWVNEGIQ